MEISLFHGIRITMNFNDRVPPHFHAQYAEYNVQIDIIRAVAIRGFFPARQLKLVLAWCELHRDELMQNWELAQAGKPLNRSNPLV